ncbi:bifunctional DNA primase/polymerase [Amycolatopsis acidicola]|uniref:Bifunctional DNA primase/polymerase n=1 Tax=Amycolatopsis acidicola TaxID=2596893 RepID=A0A5N0UZ46_9PSEU|nr:bifunctional DNA primase/polymerase [Amycolatopsis acidicola]KAA9157963.1 bifunctional DNA primase/polymerase [Amycolatopsis acidicola]
MSRALDIQHGNEFLASALAAAARGWRVFPLKPGTKKPSIAAWEQQATVDPARIRQWWAAVPDRNIGVACGPSGLLVLDLDPADGPVPRRWAAQGIAHGRDMIALLARRAHQPDPTDTLIVVTPRGGEHRYFLRPEGLWRRSTVGDRGRGIGWRVDTRGPGSLVVAPGSVGSANGHAVTYTIVRDGPIAPLPDWLAAMLTRQSPRRRVTMPADIRPVPSRRIRAYVNAAITAESRAVANAEEGHRHLTLYAAAAALGELVGSGWVAPSLVTYHLTEAGRRHVGVGDFDWNELTGTIRDGIEAGRRNRRVLRDRPRG